MTTSLLNLKYKWQDIAAIPWAVSEIGINGVKRYDLDYRKSFEHMCEIPETNTENRNSASTCWKMLKYENGFFKKHTDHKAHPHHSGVDVLLPPKSLCSYQGGELVVYAKNEEKSFSPHETMWTMIHIHLGTAHEVKPVVGVRISFVRAVYSEQECNYNANEKDVEAIVTDS